jgi:hypothetical protein
MGYMEMLQLMLGLLPQVIGAVQAVETAFPGKGQGPTKLNAVLSTVNAVAAAAPAVISSGQDIRVAVKQGDAQNITTGLTHMIGSVVNLFNATGAFQKSGFVQAVTAAQNAAPAGQYAQGLEKASAIALNPEDMRAG